MKLANLLICLLLIAPVQASETYNYFNNLRGPIYINSYNDADSLVDGSALNHDRFVIIKYGVKLPPKIKNKLIKLYESGYIGGLRWEESPPEVQYVEDDYKHANIWEKINAFFWPGSIF